MGFTSRKIDFKMWGSGVRHLLARLNETRPVASCLQNLPKEMADSGRDIKYLMLSRFLHPYEILKISQ